MTATALPDVHDLLGPDAPGAQLASLATLAHGRPVDPGPTVITQIPYAYGSPTTGGLFRVAGVDRFGEPWSLFCKVLQHVRYWPALPFLPLPTREHFVNEFPWRSELEVWEPLFTDRLPAGLRPPQLYLIADLGGDRLAVWMEDVAHDPAPWDTARFTRAARLLGRFAGRSASAEVLAACPRPVGYALRMYAENSVPTRALVPLADDDLWSNPRLAAHADLRSTLRRLGVRIPELLDRLDALPQSMPHGDASPQNLLVPADSPDEFVVIDISFQTPQAVGFDLGQLLVGLVHADLVPATELGAVADAIEPAFVAGLADVGSTVTTVEVEQGFWISLLLRTGFDSMRYDLVDSADRAEAYTFEQRLELTRFVTTRAERVLDAWDQIQADGSATRVATDDGSSPAAT